MLTPWRTSILLACLLPVTASSFPLGTSLPSWSNFFYVIIIDSIVDTSELCDPETSIPEPISKTGGESD